ncbi:SDR family NAD(P)-dependent oxidoreductase [Seonamhaeicola sp.]|uniref:SDR family NAD(P)-dependent oxidoreductase n=1 Tax=Seonamhaeicola sp. TaxID=1912245 RepID=UPI00262315EA|nr:SDR family NAD(P)-dependent oxidoreductase [Seonamhaeicola sp.]
MNKTVLITGSTDGIGKLAAIKLAKEGHQVYIHGRHQEKLKTVIDDIKKASNNDLVNGFIADFSDLKTVKILADTIKNELPKLDVLINNAGVYKSRINTTPEGLDIRFVVNYLAPFVFTNALIPLLKKGDHPRVINLSSAAQSSFSLDELSGKQDVLPNEAYAKSKLALTMWSFDLAKNQKNIQVIAVNPGSLLNTNMVKEAFGHHWSSADKGASILYELAVSEAFNGVSGQYFDNDRGGFGNAHANAYNEVKINELISATHQICDSSY